MKSVLAHCVRMHSWFCHSDESLHALSRDGYLSDLLSITIPDKSNHFHAQYSVNNISYSPEFFGKDPPNYSKM